jgi:hypothetical protein
MPAKAWQDLRPAPFRLFVESRNPAGENLSVKILYIRTRFYIDRCPGSGSRASGPQDMGARKDRFCFSHAAHDRIANAAG